MKADLQALAFRSLSRLHRLLPTRGTRRIPPYGAFYRSLFESQWRFWPSDNVLHIQGSKMYLEVFHEDPTLRNTFRAYARNRIHEKYTTGLFKKVVKPGNIFLDLGANVGYFTLLAARLVGKSGRVYAFEPEPRNFRYLTRNLQLNHYDQVTAEQKAVSDSSGKVKLFICPYDSGHHTINQSDGIKSYRPEEYTKSQDQFVEVDKIAVDEYLQNTPLRVDAIKMDVEGAELLALTGLDQTIRKNDNLKMFVEFFPLLIKDMGASPEEFIRRLLQDYQFSTFVIGGDYSMSEKIQNRKFFQVHTVEELLRLCPGEKDHLNLFLQKGKGKDQLA